MQHGITFFRDVSLTRAAIRTATALGQTTARLVTSGTTDEILAEIAQHAVEGTSALACGIDVVDEDGQMLAAGGYGFPSYLSETGETGVRSRTARAAGRGSMADLSAGAIKLGDRPGRPIVVPDARSAWLADPMTSHFAATLESLDWQAAVYLPLAWENRVFGFCCVYLPTGIAGPTEMELAFYAVLADQAAVAVTNARLSVQAGQDAAQLERSQLARDLHDSVSQALFSMTMQARAAQLAISGAGLDNEALDRTIEQLVELTGGATAEMRALIFELRPGELAQAGLVAALHTQAAALGARDQLLILVDGPEERVCLEPELEEHLYRITSEALHNAVKHSRAGRVTVNISESQDGLRILVSDDGVGFDPASDHTGHLGLSTMSERAALIGGELTVTSGVGTGTTVSLSVPDRHRWRLTRTAAFPEGAGAAETPTLLRSERSAEQHDIDQTAERAQKAEGGASLETHLQAAIELGLAALSAIVSGARDGIAIVDSDRRYIYANPAACEIFGTSLEDLLGKDLLTGVPTREHPLVLAYLAEQPAGSSSVFSNLLIDAAGLEHEIVSSVFPVSLDGVALSVSLFRDVAETRTAGRAAVALAQAAAQVVEADTTSKILSGLARNAVEGTSAIASEILATGDHKGRIESGAYSQVDPAHGAPHPPRSLDFVDTPLAEVIEALTGGAIRVGDVAAVPIVLSDTSETWRRYPCLAEVHAWDGNPTWQGAAVFVPLAWQNQVFGLFGAYLPTGVAGPTEGELAFYTAAADQAAVAVMSARLANQAREAAALSERTRLARDLHDSVSQSLFSITMQVRAAQRLLDHIGVGGTAPLSRSITSLSELSRGAMAEMRALIFELRPGAVAEEGLEAAIRKRAAAVSAREDLPITVEVPHEPRHLDAVTAEQLYRIASESLLGLIRTSRPHSVSVTIRHDGSGLRVEIRATGEAVGSEVVGLTPLPRESALSERGVSIGAEVLFDDGPETGRTVIISLPQEARRTVELSDDA